MRFSFRSPRTDFPAQIPLRPGEWVQVKSWDEIQKTLDENGMLDLLPFMPEMLPFCGQRLRVAKRADRTCEGVIRKMNNAVHLDGLRCDGSAHGGCQANCTFMWKEAWLRRLSPEELNNTPRAQTVLIGQPLRLRTLRASVGQDSASRYICQTTQLRAATSPLSIWDMSQLWSDVRCGNIRLKELGVLFTWLWQYLFWFAFKLQSKSAKTRVKRTPTERLDLHAGDRVRVKSRAEIFHTLDYLGKNRGLAFSAEMLKHCGKEFTVKARVDRMLVPGTGEMMEMKNPCIILESVSCAGQCMFCPRGLYHYWREIWLERVENSAQQPPAHTPIPLYSPSQNDPEPPSTRVA